MDLRHLRHFVAVAEEGHFGRAAARLGIEQSPLSRSIRHLETQLRTTLLERSPRGSQLTAVGIALLPEARAILDQVARLKTLSSATQLSRTCPLRLGVCDAVATTRLRRCLSALRTQHPELEIVVTPLHLSEVISAVDVGAVDASIALDPMASAGIARNLCWTEEFLVAVTDGGKFFSGPTIPMASLLAVDEVLVAAPWAAAAQRWLHELAAGNTDSIPLVRHLPSCLGLLTSIGMDVGIGLVPSGLADRLGWAAISTHAVEGHNPRLPVVLLHRENNQHGGIAALRTVIDTRPWLFKTTASVAAPAETRGHSP